MKRRLALTGIILATLAVSGMTGYKVWINTHKAGQTRQNGAPAIVAYTVTPQDFTDRIEAIGTAQPNEAATLTATAADTVTAINFEEGAFVAQSTVLVQLNDAEERAEMEDARKNAARYSALAKTSASSAAQSDTATTAFAMSEARVKDRQIIAPFDGIAGFRNISIGDLVTPGMAVTTLYDIDPIKLEFTLPENYLSVAQAGLEIEARTSAWPDRIFKGAVIVVDPHINPETRAIALKAEIPNTDSALKPGLLMTVNVIKNKRKSLSVPEGALLQQGENHNVYLIDKEGKAQLTPVTIGTRETGYVEIINGLKDGDTIVAEGLLKIRPGMAVKIVKTVTLNDMIEAARQMAPPRKQKALE